MTQNVWVAFLGDGDSGGDGYVDPTKYHCTDAENCGTAGGAAAGVAIGAEFGLPPQVGAAIGGFIGGKLGGALAATFGGSDCSYGDTVNDVSLSDAQTETLSHYAMAVSVLGAQADVIWADMDALIAGLPYPDLLRSSIQQCFTGVGSMRNAIFYGLCRTLLSYISENPDVLPKDVTRADVINTTANAANAKEWDKVHPDAAADGYINPFTADDPAAAMASNDAVYAASQGSGAGGGSSTSHTGLAVAGLVVAAGAAWVFRDKIKKWIH